MAIYTKTGDNGETSFFGGKRIMKSDLRICVYGELDELNSILGMVRGCSKHSELNPLLKTLQEDLFIVGADIAAEHAKIGRTSAKMVERLEKEIDGLEEKLPPLNNFILPTGTQAASTLHFARSVCRRTERRLIELHQKEQMNPEILQYVNRLSDLLFVMARTANRLDGHKEEVWKQ
ncbi:MAG: cob(I)yrinic acid a,c-diamide adenosyltransferase [Candidatus Micrarchaeota archaeon]